MRVAAAGHRYLPPPVAEQVRASAREVLQTLTALVPPARIEVVTSLAEGADRLVSEAALEVGARLAALLPFQIDQYEQTFDLGDAEVAKNEFRRLLAAAKAGGGVTLMGLDFGDRDRAYHASAVQVVRDCDLLIAVLSEGKQASNTAESVRRALAAGVPVVRIEPERPDAWRLETHDG
jgi:hypothetical protein